MAYLVKTTVRAELDLAHLFEEVNARHSEAALKWYRGLKEAILSLGDHPNRCPITRKKGELRHFLYGHRPDVYRVIFRVHEPQKHVEVLHIRHGARQKLKVSELT